MPSTRDKPLRTTWSQPHGHALAETQCRVQSGDKHRSNYGTSCLLSGPFAPNENELLYRPLLCAVLESGTDTGSRAGPPAGIDQDINAQRDKPRLRLHPGVPHTAYPLRLQRTRTYWLRDAVAPSLRGDVCVRTFASSTGDVCVRKSGPRIAVPDFLLGRPL